MSQIPLVSRPGLASVRRDLDWCRDLDTIQVTVWTLFMGTVHEHCSQGKKNTKFLKIFLCMI